MKILVLGHSFFINEALSCGSFLMSERVIGNGLVDIEVKFLLKMAYIMASASYIYDKELSALYNELASKL